MTNSYTYKIIDQKLVNKSNKKIISYCLFGIGSKRDSMRNYYDGIIVNYTLAKELYPDWICRIYIDSKVSKDKIDELYKLNNLEIIIIETNIPFMCIRFLPFDDTDVDIWISRDLDSIISLREKHAVDEWLSSNKDMHIMHDHKHHIDMILAGMFGIKNTFKFNFFNEINNYNNVRYNINYDIDAGILSEIFSKYYKNNYIQHHRAGYKLENSFSLNTPGDFIGKAHDMSIIKQKMTL